MEKEKNSMKDKVLTVIGTIMCIVLVPILAINITLLTKSFVNKDEVPNVGGVFPMIVLTDSMYPEIAGGDLIICHTVEAKNVKEGDIISFFDPAGNGTSIVTHRVVEIIEEDGEIKFRTRGDNNNTDDKLLVPDDNLVGTYQMKIDGAGNVAMFMQSTTGLIICVALPIAALIAYDVTRRRIYEKSRKKDEDALLEELKALRAEKAAKEKAALENGANETPAE